MGLSASVRVLIMRQNSEYIIGNMSLPKINSKMNNGKGPTYNDLLDSQIKKHLNWTLVLVLATLVNDDLVRVLLLLFLLLSLQTLLLQFELS